MEPAAAEGRRRGLGVVVVAEHDVVAAHHDLAHRGAVARHVGVVGVDHAHEIGRRIGLALAGEHARAPRRVQLGEAVGLGAHGDRAVGLGQAVDVHDAEVELLQAREQRRRGRRRGREHGHRPLQRGAPTGWLTTPMCTVGAPL